MFAHESAGKSFSHLLVLGSHGEVAEALERHFLGMARTTHHQLLSARHAVELGEIVGDEHIFVGHNAFDGVHHAFVADVLGDFCHVTFEVGRRHCQQQSVGFAAHVVDVR